MVLVTTAIQETLPKGNDEEVLFLGEWCKPYDQKYIWEKFDSNTVDYHWNDRKKLYNDTKYLDEIYEKYLLILANQLNEIHTEQHSIRYWRIVIGVWLRRFIEIIYDRYISIENAFIVYQIDKTYILDMEYVDAIPVDMHDFNYLHTNDDWNHFIYSQLIKSKQCQIIHTKYKKKITHTKVVSNKYKKTSTYFNRLNKICFFASYFEREFLIKLQLSLKQMPSLDYLDRFSVRVKYNKTLRDRINLSSNSNDKFGKVLQKLIPIQIPYSYLESYKLLTKNALNTYPVNPEIIITANGYSSYDDFKIWVAAKVENNTKLGIIQHGGHYGTGLFASNEKHEINIADKYFSWGWSIKNNIKVQPMNAIRFSNTIQPNLNGDILMPLMDLPRFSYILLSMPIAGQMLNYIKDQQDFLLLLNNELKKLVKLRIYPTELGWSVKARLANGGFKNQVDSNKNLNKNFVKRLSECRLCIATYNATTYLETFASNYPTLLFWDKKYWELNIGAQPYFDKLHKVGILHYDAKSLANKLEEIYQNPMKWWIQNEVQLAKNEFCIQFANIINKPLKKWSKELKQMING